MQKTFFLSLHGCAKNQVDAELIFGALTKSGWTLVDSAKDASVIVINSCGFIESAKSESIMAVLQARKENPKAKIILAGCLAERYADALSENLPEADVFFGNGNISKITEIFDSLLKNNFDTGLSIKDIENNCYQKKIWLYPQEGISSGPRPKLFNFKNSAYIKITEGCSNYCSFCAIPIIRGEVRSRPIVEITAEIKELLARGVFEFNLIGQDLAAFSAEQETSKAKLSGLAHLLKEISKLKGDFVIRLLYIHPDHFPLDILPIMQKDERLLPYFDIPFQSASKRILKAMNRSGKAEIYLDLIQKINANFLDTSYKGACFRTTFLTGFPGETEDDFNESLNFLKKLKPLWSGTFIFSPEENTKAFSLPNPVPEATAIKRQELLQNTQIEISSKLLENFVGQELILLVEEIIENPDDENFFVLGRVWFQAPEVDGCVVVPVYDKKTANKISEGMRIKVKIRGARGLDLEADFLSF